MNIADIFDTTDELDRLVREHYISRVVSPDGRFFLYNYTEKATYARLWTAETRQCRGLIVRADTGAIVAWPFDKFHNVGELPETTPEALAERAGPVEATEKLDGSMVAVWYDADAGDWVCTTRGSFTSAQALAARRWLTERSTDFRNWPYRTTFLCEWTAPDNRVVLKYERPELVLIGARRRFDGLDADYSTLEMLGDLTGLRVVPIVTGATLESLLAQVNTASGCEGWVLRWPGGFRVKVKTAEYVALHRLVSDFSPKRVHEAMLAGSETAFIASLPDELQDEARAIAVAITSAYTSRLARILELYQSLDKHGTRKEFALAVQRYAPAEDRSYLFSLADGKPIAERLLRDVDPSAIEVLR